MGRWLAGLSLHVRGVGIILIHPATEAQLAEAPLDNPRRGNLDRDRPLRKVAAFDGVEQVAQIIVGVRPGNLRRPGVRDALMRLINVLKYGFHFFCVAAESFLFRTNSPQRFSSVVRSSVRSNSPKQSASGSGR